ncbi:HAD family hydrolase [Bryobacter aggregatus]|uniref:HAD family hydrolase n=1 Tax=Bryobacter aggregatus TaxID=360054 RepID=UPI001EE1E35B|nr:HAD-IA family hydrolase [Bryobacter aggregatus]
MEENANGHPQQNGTLRPFPAPRLLIFDLDGTLIDSKADLVSSVNATRAYMQMPPLDESLIASYVGNGAPVLIKRAMGEDASQGRVEEALEYFIKYYHDHCLDETRLYPGIAETLQAAQERDIRLAILTNKPVRISNIILDGLGLGSTFFRVYGGNSFLMKKPDPIGIDTLRAESGTPADQTLMIGDSHVDIQTARNAKVYSVGLTYGLQPESLITTPPDLLLDRIEDLIPHL